MIDFELLKYADLEVVNSTPTPEELREISAFLKANNEKEARREKARAVPLRTAVKKAKHV